jgi:TPR repeat protein
MRGLRALVVVSALLSVSASAQEAPQAPATSVDPSRFGDTVEPKDAIGKPPVRILKSKEITPKTDGNADGPINPTRFGEKTPDDAYGAFQRGLYKTAYNLALPRAEKGDGPAQALVAEIVSRGLGVPVNVSDAAKWFQKAAENNIPEAQFQYALMLLDGKSVPRDEAKAQKMLEASSQAGNPLAQFNLAQLYVQNNRGPEGLKKAVPYYQSAAEAGLPDAQYAMSQIYANGAGGIAKDDKEARRWLTLAARQGYDTAEIDLGTWLVDGRGGDRDANAGFRWLKKAADDGNIAAMNRVAKLYMQGIGTEPNTIDAAAWYFLARRAGLTDYEMNDFLAGLTDDELKKALERANRLR